MLQVVLLSVNLFFSLIWKWMYVFESDSWHDLIRRQFIIFVRVIFLSLISTPSRYFAVFYLPMIPSVSRCFCWYVCIKSLIRTMYKKNTQSYWFSFWLVSIQLTASHARCWNAYFIPNYHLLKRVVYDKGQKPIFNLLLGCHKKYKILSCCNSFDWVGEKEAKNRIWTEFFSSCSENSVVKAVLKFWWEFLLLIIFLKKHCSKRFIEMPNVFNLTLRISLV